MKQKLLFLFALILIGLMVVSCGPRNINEPEKKEVSSEEEFLRDVNENTKEYFESDDSAIIFYIEMGIDGTNMEFEYYNKGNIYGTGFAFDMFGEKMNDYIAYNKDTEEFTSSNDSLVTEEMYIDEVVEDNILLGDGPIDIENMDIESLEKLEENVLIPNSNVRVDMYEANIEGAGRVNLYIHTASETVYAMELTEEMLEEYMEEDLTGSAAELEEYEDPIFILYLDEEFLSSELKEAVDEVK